MECYKQTLWSCASTIWTLRRSTSTFFVSYHLTSCTLVSSSRWACGWRWWWWCWWWWWLWWWWWCGDYDGGGVGDDGGAAGGDEDYYHYALTSSIYLSLVFQSMLRVCRLVKIYRFWEFLDRCANIQAEFCFPIKSNNQNMQKYGNVLIIDNTNIRSGRSVTQTIRISSECSPW